MHQRGRELSIYWFILSLLFIAVILILKPSNSPTGFFLFPTATPIIEAEKVWDLETATEYSFDNSKINFSGGEVKLLPTVTTTIKTRTENNESLLASATVHETNRNPKDETSKVTSIEQGHVELKDDKKVLEFTLEKGVITGDVLSLYILEGSTSQGKIYACTANTGCSSGELGELTLPQLTDDDDDDGDDDDDDEGKWYNLTLTGIDTAKTTFSLDSPHKIKIDALKGYQIRTIEEVTTTITYPSSASVETTDFQPANLKSWGLFSKTEQLNNQQVEYHYSTDSGTSWTTVPGTGNLSSVTGATLRLRAVLSSTGNSTPRVQEMRLIYSIQEPCIENWTASYGSCLPSDTQLKTYTDANGCGTKDYLPADNGTYGTCDFCIPAWLPANTSCRPADRFTTWYADLNGCYSATKSAADLATKPENSSVSCNYCAEHDCTSSFQAVINSSLALNSTTWMIDAKEKAKTQLEITAPLAEGEVTILEYNKSLVNATPPALDLGKQLEINSTVENITSVKIIVHYTDEELQQGNIDESTVKIYYYNQTSGAWQALPSVVNATGNYVYAVVDHLSLYGLYGEQVQSGSGRGSAGAGGETGGGGRGGGGRNIIENTVIGTEPSPSIIESVTEAVQPVLEVPASLPAVETVTELERPCNYAVEVSLPDTISFLGSDSFSGEIENKGNCDLSSLQLDVSPALQGMLTMEPASFPELKKGEKDTFILIRRQQQREKLFSIVTTLATAEGLGNQTVTGAVILTSAGRGEEQFYGRELPVTIVVPAPLRLTSPPTVKLAIVVVLFTSLLAALKLDKMERERRRKELEEVKDMRKYLKKA